MEYFVIFIEVKTRRPINIGLHCFQIINNFSINGH